MNNVYPSTHPLIAAKLTRLRDVRTHFPVYQGLVVRRLKGLVRAVDGIDLDIPEGEALGLVGDRPPPRPARRRRRPSRPAQRPVGMSGTTPAGADASGAAPGATALPASLRFIERDWLSSNQVLFFDGEGAQAHASLVDTGYVKHAELTLALVRHVLARHGLPERALTRILKRNNYTGRLHALVNMADSLESARKVYQRFAQAVHKYMQVDIDWFGHVSADRAVVTSVRLQHPVILVQPDAPASRCFHALAQGLEQACSGEQGPGLAEHLRSLQPETAVDPASAAIDMIRSAQPTRPVAREANLGELHRQFVDCIQESKGSAEELVAAIKRRYEAPLKEVFGC
mgnify:CR=1 FL=1